jgi:anion-transporting  ArsA/GET3 family ATPase
MSPARKPKAARAAAGHAAENAERRSRSNVEEGARIRAAGALNSSKSESKTGSNAGSNTGDQLEGGVRALATSSSIVVTCGAGGVGKTTVAAAIGLGAARHSEQRVLVLTIDPAKRLAAALGLQSVGNEATPIPLVGAKGSLAIAMLDTSASWDDLIRRISPDDATTSKILANPLYRNITQRFVQSHDYVAMERLYELREQGSYDLIVIDTPPSRNALDFLDAPQRMADFFSSTLLKWITMPYRLGGERAGRLGYLAAKPFYQVADRILGSDFLADIAEFFLLFQSMYDGFVKRASSVGALLHAEDTTFVVISTPSESPLQEAEFFLAELERRNLRTGALVVNRTLPELFLDDRTRRAAAGLLDAVPVSRVQSNAVPEAVLKSNSNAESKAVSGVAGRGSTQGRQSVQTGQSIPSVQSEHMVKAVAETFLRFADTAETQKRELAKLAKVPATVVRIPLFETPLADVDGLGSVVDAIW